MSISFKEAPEVIIIEESNAARIFVVVLNSMWTACIGRYFVGLEMSLDGTGSMELNECE